MDFKIQDDSDAPTASLVFERDGSISGAKNSNWLPPTGVGQRIIVNGENGPLVTIDLQTGKHTFAEDADIDEAARTFWQFVSEYARR